MAHHSFRQQRYRRAGRDHERARDTWWSRFTGEYHGIYRDIPIEYPGPHGSNYELFLKVTGVTDAHRPQAEI